MIIKAEQLEAAGNTRCHRATAVGMQHACATPMVVEWVGVVSLLYLLACALQYRYHNNIHGQRLTAQSEKQMMTSVKSNMTAIR
jgi:hypothetical protein